MNGENGIEVFTRDGKWYTFSGGRSWTWGGTDDQLEIRGEDNGVIAAVASDEWIIVRFRVKAS